MACILCFSSFLLVGWSTKSMKVPTDKLVQWIRYSLLVYHFFVSTYENSYYVDLFHLRSIITLSPSLMISVSIIWCPFLMPWLIFSDPLRFHVFGIGQRSVGFSIRIEVKTESKITVCTFWNNLCYIYICHFPLRYHILLFALILHNFSFMLQDIILIFESTVYACGSQY